MFGIGEGISEAIEKALQGFGEGTMDVGNKMILAGYKVWSKSCQLTVRYLKVNPVTKTNAWGIVTGRIWNLSMSIAASLCILYFVLGWLNESIDIRSNFSLDNMFRFFIRYILTATLLINSLSLIRGITDCATAIVGTVSITQSEMDQTRAENIFDDLKTNMETEENSGASWIGTGLVCMLAGCFGGVVIIVCSLELLIAVLSRLFKLYLCIPFAPVALAGFAGGGQMSQMGIAWLRTFGGYALEALVMALAIRISFGLFADGSSLIADSSITGVVGAVLTIVEYCLPMITCCACVKGAETIVRRSLGLG